MPQVHKMQLAQQNTAAKPTRLWKPATNCGISVIAILFAIIAPTIPPIAIATITNITVWISEVKKLTENKVAKIAITIPKIPKIFPLLELSGEESPLRQLWKIHRIQHMQWQLGLWAFILYPLSLVFSCTSLAFFALLETLQIYSQRLKAQQGSQSL